MNKVIPIWVDDEHVLGDGRVIGVAGSYHDVSLDIAFISDVWQKKTLSMQWRNSKGEKVADTLLTADLIENGRYRVVIPAKVKEFPGEVQVIIRGTDDTSITLSAEGHFDVLTADYEAEETPLEPTQVEQLQGEITNLLGQVVALREAKTQAETAAENAATAQASAETAQDKAESAEVSAKTWAAGAESAATAAARSAAAAEKSAQAAQTGGGSVDLSGYAKKTDIPETLPNPQPLTINGQRYDGREAVEVNVESTPTPGSITEAMLAPEVREKIGGDVDLSGYAKQADLADTVTWEDDGDPDEPGGGEKELPDVSAEDAGKVATVMDDGTWGVSVPAASGGGIEWTLLKTVDMTVEDGATVKITGLDGYTHFRVFAEMLENSTATASSYWLYINGKQLFNSLAIGASGKKNYQSLFADYDGLIWQIGISTAAISSTNYAPSDRKHPYNYPLGVGAAETIELSVANSTYKPTGGKLIIYGGK